MLLYLANHGNTASVTTHLILFLLQLFQVSQNVFICYIERRLALKEKRQKGAEANTYRPVRQEARL